MNPFSCDKNENTTLLWPKLISGILIRRYKRFLADIKLETGDTIVAHCPNSGRMTGCSRAGQPVYVSFHDDAKRKLKYTWELIDMPGSLVGINTQVPNRLVYHAVTAGAIPELAGYNTVRKEVRAGLHTRFDLMLTGKQGEQCYVEIKNSTLVEDSTAFFPDAVTSRGKKQLAEMQTLIKSGHRCVVFYLVQRMDANRFKPADHIDPAYCGELRSAAGNGIEIFAYDVHIDLRKIRLGKPLACDL